MLKVLVVGQTPPPFHGQAMMIQRLVTSELKDVEIVHVRMAFSSTMDDVGRFRIGKLLHLVWVIVEIVRQRMFSGARVLYYPPAGPNKVPMLRDVAILCATRWMFAKTIFHFHASGLSELYDRLPGWQRALFRAAYFGVDAAVRISELTPEDGKLIEAQREFVVANGIDNPWPAVPVRDFGPISVERPLRILYVGMLHEGKGLLTIVDACGRLQSQGVPFQLELMGQPDSEEFDQRLKARIAKLQLEERVTFLGVLQGNDKWAAYERADVHCHPTFYDTVPVVVLEAMAAGLPVVSTFHSGIPSLVDDGQTGILVTPRDDGAVADALGRLAADGAMRQKFGMAGRARYEKHFTLSAHAEQMRAVFLEVGQEASARAVRRSEALAAS